MSDRVHPEPNHLSSDAFARQLEAHVTCAATAAVAATHAAGHVTVGTIGATLVELAPGDTLDDPQRLSSDRFTDALEAHAHRAAKSAAGAPEQKAPDAPKNQRA